MYFVKLITFAPAKYEVVNSILCYTNFKSYET
jgi:hypothetical protein